MAWIRLGIMVMVLFSVIIFVGVLLPKAPQATRALQVNLAQLAERADKIFVGRCLSSESKVDPRIKKVVTVSAFAVEEKLKGRLEDEITIKQYGGTTPSLSNRIAGIPEYAPGERVILFLYEESRYGLTSPVGLAQGKFVFVQDKHHPSKTMVINGLNNKGLFKGMEKSRLMLDHRLGQTQKRALARVIDQPHGSVNFSDFLALLQHVMNGSQ